MNKIEGLERADGSKCSSAEEDHAEVQSFYQALYTSQGFHQTDELLQFVPNRVTDAMNEALEKPYTEEEIRHTLFQMGPSKASGVNGFTVGFFQRHWHFLKDDIVLAMLDFFNGGELPTGMNDTSITLIPKGTSHKEYPNTVPFLYVQFCIRSLSRLLLTAQEDVWMRLLVMSRVHLSLDAKSLTMC